MCYIEFRGKYKATITPKEKKLNKDLTVTELMRPCSSCSATPDYTKKNGKINNPVEQDGS